MKAAVLHGAKDIRTETVPDPVCQPHGVIGLHAVQMLDTWGAGKVTAGARKKRAGKTPRPLKSFYS